MMLKLFRSQQWWLRVSMLCMAGITLVSCNQNGGSLVDSLVGIKGSLLDGGGVGNDSLTFTPNPLDFGNIAVNTATSVATISVRNKSTVGISILTMKASGNTTDLEVVSDSSCKIGMSLNADETCTLRVQVNSAVAGKFQHKVDFEFAPSVEKERIFTNQANVIGNAIAPLNFDGVLPIASADVSTSKVTVRWNLIEGASSYVISKQDDNGNFVSAGSAAAGVNSFTITGLSASTPYSFRVNALNLLGVPDTNEKTEQSTTDGLGQFAPLPNLAASEGTQGSSPNLGGFCTDTESNTPQLVIVDNPSSADLHCVVLSGPYRIACTPGFRDGSDNWTGTVDVKCLLNDYPVPYTQTLNINVSNIFRPPTLAAINGQNAIGGKAIVPVQAVASSSDEASFTYTCLYDQSVDGTVANTAANCNSLINQDGSNAIFTSAGNFTWIPRVADGSKSFEFKVKATGDNSGLSDSKIFVINVGYPPPDPTTSTIAVSSTTINSGSSATVTVTVKDEYGNTIPKGGASIVLSNSGGTSTGTFGTLADHGDGTYTSLFTGVLAGTPTTISATLQGTAITTPLPTLQVNYGPISSTRSLISVSASPIVSGDSAELTLLAKDAAGNLVPQGGANVVFNRSGGGSTGIISATTDHGDGTYSATFTGVLAGTPTTIGAKINTISVSTTLPTLKVLPGAVSVAQSLISVSGNPTTLSAGNGAQIILTSKDAAGNSLTSGGLNVSFGFSGGISDGTFGTVTDNLDGTYSVIFTGTTAGTASTFSATIGGITLTSAAPSLIVLPGSPSISQSLVSVSQSSITSGTVSVLTLSTVDAYGNALISGGHSVSFNHSGGTSTGTIGGVADNGDGTYAANFTGTLAGTATSISATIDAAPISRLPKPTIIVTPGSISALRSLVTVSAATVPSGNNITVSLRAKDAAGNNLSVGGSLIAFNRSGGTSTGTFASVTDTNSGIYSTSFTGLLAGTPTTIGATIGGVAVTTTLPTVSVTPGVISAATSQVSVATSSLPSGGGSAITLTAKDAAGNSLLTGNDGIAFSYSNGTSTITIGSVTDNGNGSYSAPITAILAGTPITINASVNSANVTSTLPTLTVVPGAASAVNSTIEASSTTTSSGSAITITVHTIDAAGNLRTSGGDTVHLSHSGGTSTGTIGTISDLGDGNYTATFTGVLAGTATNINGTINGTPITSTPRPTILVTPGAIAASRSTVSVSANTVASGSSVTVTVTGKDAAGNTLTTGGSAVTFARTGGTSTGTFGSTVDQGNGSYVASFTGSTAGSATTISGYIAGAPITTLLPTVQVTPGPISGNYSLLAVSSGTVNSGSTMTITLIGKDAANNSITSGGALVTMSASGGTSTGTIGTVSDNANGTYSAIFTGIVAGTPLTISANINGVEVTTTLPAVTVIPGAISAATSLLSSSTSTLASGSSAAISLQAKDAAGNNLSVGGASVLINHAGGSSTGTISSVTDNGNGTYSANFTGVIAGTATTITATINSASVSTTPTPKITVVPGLISVAQSSLSASGTSVASGQNINVTLQAKDSAGNIISSGGSNVAFSRSGGSSTGTFGSVTDNGNGTYGSTFTGLVAGTATSLHATIGGIAVTSAAPSVTVVPGPVSSSFSTVVASATQVNSGASITLTLSAVDDNGNLVGSGGAIVAFNSIGGSSTGTIGTVSDNGNGTYSATFTGVLAGTATTITSTINGVPVATSMPTITVNPGAISAITSVLSTSTSSLSSGTTATLTLLAKDAAGNSLSSGGSTVVFSQNGGTSTGLIGATSDSGNGSYHAVFTGHTAGSATTVRATINGATVSSSPLPTLTVTPGAISVSSSTIEAASATVASGSSVLITLRGKDAAGNSLSSATAAVTFSRSGGTSTGSFGSITNNGDGTYSALFTGYTAGTATSITGTIDGNSLSTTPASVSVTPGLISATTSNITLAHTTVVSGLGVTATLQAKDAAGNNLNSGGAIVAFSYSGGSSTGNFGTTVDNGNGTYSATFTGVIAGTATAISATVNTSAILSTLPTLTVLPGSASSLQSLITASSSTLPSGSSITVTVQGKDAAGNLVSVGGETINFSTASGTSTGTFSTVNDNNDGTYSTTFTGYASGTASTINASINGSPITSTPKPNITVTPGALSLAQSLVTVSSSTVSSGSNITVSLLAKDSAGNSLNSGGALVAFSRTGGTSTGSFSVVTDHNDGTYSATFAGAAAGTPTSIHATVGGLNLTSNAPSVTVTPGNISATNSTLAISLPTVSSGNTVTASLTAIDSNGNLLTSGGSSILFSLAGGTSTGSFSATSDNGNGIYSSVFTGAISGTASNLSATINGIPVATTPPTITVTPGAPSAAKTELAVQDTSITSGTSTTISALAKDAAGNTITTGGGIVLFSTSGGTATGTIGATTDHGDGTYTATFVGVHAGSSTAISATINGSPITTLPKPTVAVTPGVISIASSTLSVSAPTVASGSSITVTLQAKDAAGNNLTTGGASVAFSRSGGTSTGTFGSISDNGNGTYSASFTGIVAGTATTFNATIGGVSVSSTMPTVSVTPGLISATTSTLAVSNSNVASGAAITVTLSGKDAAGNSLTTGGSNVLFSNSGGTSTGTFSSTTDNGDGTYTASFNGVIAGSATTLTATLGGISVSTTPPTITVTPGAPSAATSQITASASSVASGSGVTVAVQAKDAAGNSLTTGSAIVVFSAAGGSSTGSFASVTDNTDGTYTSVFTGILAGSATTISATINGSPITTLPKPTVAVTPGVISIASSTLSVSAPTVASGSSITVTLQAKDAAGNNLHSGSSVIVFSYAGGASTGAFSTVTNNNDGTYSAFFSGLLAGTPTTMHATIDGTTVTTSMPTVAVTPGPIAASTSTLAVSGTTVNSGASVSLTLSGKDAAGNSLAAGGSTVLFSNSGGSSTGVISSTTDLGNGSYSATFTGALAGSATTLTATINGITIGTSSPTLTVLPGLPSAVTSEITANAVTVTSGSGVTVNVQAKDAAGNTITSGGATIAFSHLGGTSTGTFSSTTDNGNGTYSAIFTGTLAGTATTINATLNGTPISSASKPNLVVNPGTISSTQSQVTLASSTVASGASVLITLTAKDAAGNLLSSGGSTIVFTRSGGTSTGSFSAVSDNSNGTYSALMTGIVAGTATTINASIGGIAVSTILPTLTVIPGAISATTSTVAVSSAVVNSGSSVTLTLTAKDAAGNTLKNGGSSALFGNSGGTSTGTFSSTSDNGDGTYSALFTGVLAGSATTLTATIAGNTVSTTMPNITVNPGLPSAATSEITALASTLPSGSATTLKVQAKDAAGNLVTEGGGSVAFTFSGGTSTGSISATFDHSDGTYTATLTGILAGTASTVNASINASPITSTPKPTVIVTPGAISLANSLITIDSNPSSVASGSSVTLRLTSKDSAGNIITSGGQSVSFSYAGGISSGTIGSVLDGLDGTYSAAFVGLAAGTATTINASIGGISVTTIPHPSIVVTPGNVSLASSLVSVGNSTIQSGLTTSVTLTAKDTYGNTLNSGGSTIVFSYTGGTSTGSFVPTSDQSNGTYTTTFTGLTSGSPTNISATINGFTITSALPSITVNPGPPSVINSTIAVSASSVSSGSDVTLTLTAYDAGANILTTGGATVVFSTLNGSSTGTISSVTDNNNGTYTATFTGLVAGTPTMIKATINGSSVATTSPTITVLPGAIAASNSSLTLASSSVASGNSVLVTLQAKDSNGNRLTTGGAAITFGRTGGTSTGSFGSVTDNLNGTYSANFTGALAGTATTITSTVNGSAVSTSLPTITVTPGSVSVATSTVSVSSTSVASGAGVTLTVQAKDAAGNNLTTGSAAVSLSFSGGTSTGTISSANDNSDGTYTATFTGVLAGTATSIGALINGVAVSTSLPSITVTPGAISGATSTITATGTSVLSGGTITLSLQGKDAAGNDLTLGGSAVLFSHSGGTSTGSISATTDNGSGVYTATFTGLVAGTATSISATIGGSAVATTKPAIQVNPGAISPANSTLTLSSSSVASGSQITLTLQAKDANNNNLTSGGANIVFTKAGGTSTGTLSASTDGNNGTYTGTFTGIVAGTPLNLGANIGGTPVSTALPTVTVTPGAISMASSVVVTSSDSLASGTSATLTLTTKDAAGNLQTSGGAIVTFTTSGGTSTGTINSTIDHGDGTYTTTFTGITAGTATTVSCQVNGSSVTNTMPSLTVTPGALSLANSVLAVSATTVQSGSSITLTLTTKDAAGNALANGGQNVVFSRNSGTSTGSISAATDNNNGTYTATFTGIVSGSATSIRATVGGSLVTSANPTVTVNPGSLSLAASTLTSSVTTVASGSPTTLTLTAKDANNNLITNGAFAVAFTSSGGSSTGIMSSANDNLDGTYTATFTGIVAGTATTIAATINSSGLTSTLPQITVVPGPASLSQSTLSLSAATIASGSGSTLTLTTRDNNGNNITSGGFTVIFNASGGTSTGTISATTDAGNGTYSATFTGLLAGTATTIGATLAGDSISSTANLTVVPGAVSLTQSTISVGSSTLASGTATSLTLTARDSAGNVQTTGGLGVVFARSGGSSTGSISTTTDNNNGTYTATFNGLAAGSATSVTATVGGVSVSSGNPTITVVPGTVSVNQSTLAVLSGTIQSGTSTTLTLQAKDVNGNDLTSGGANVVFSRSGGTSTGSISSTTDGGNGSYTASFLGLVAGTATTISATINTVTLGTTLPTVVVIPGPISTSISEVTLSSSTVPSGTSITATLTAKDAGGNILTGGGSSVGFYLYGGTSTGSISTVTDNLNGTYTANITGLVAGTQSFVGATIGGTSISSSVPNLQVTVGAFSAANSTLAVSSSTVGAGNYITLTARAKDLNNNSFNSGGAVVVFNITGGTSNGTIYSTNDNNDGTYSTSFLGTTVGTAATIGATFNGVSIASSPPTVTVVPGAISAANSTMAVSSSSVTSGSAVTVTLTGKDAYNNLVTAGGRSVSFTYSGGTSTGTTSVTTDNGNGSYTASFTGILAGTATTIAATIDGTNVTTTLPTVTVNPGEISATKSLISLSQSSIIAGSTATATLTAKDAAGNNLTVGGATVVFGRSGGVSSGTFSATTDSTNGSYAANFLGTTAGTATSITATVNGTAVSTTLPTITVTPGAVSVAESTLSLSSTTVASNSSGTVTLQAKDSYGNSISVGGLIVVFNRTGGTSTLSMGTTTDNSNGTYSATYSGQVAGSATTIGATIGGVAVSSTLPTVTVTPGTISVAESLVTVSSPTVNSGSTLTLTLTAKDSYANTLSSGGSSVAFARSGGISNGTIGSTTDNGDGTYTATFAGTTAGSATTVTATIGGIAVTSTLPTITVSPGPISVAQSLVSVSSATIASGSDLTVTLTSKDASGNSLTSGGSVVSFGRTGGVSAGTFSSVNNLGNGTYTATFTGSTAGSPTTITATIGGVAVTSALPTVTVTPGPFSLADSVITLSSNSVASSASITATLQVKDAAGNNLTNGGLGVVFSRSGGVSSGTFGATVDNSNGTYQASFTGTTAGSATTIAATISGSALTSTLPTVTVTPGGFSLANSLISVSASTIASGSNSTLTLTAKDANDNALTSGGLAVAFTRSGGSSTGTIGPVTDNTNGTYTAVFSAALSGTPTSINATINNSPVTTSSPTITVIPGAVSLAQSLVTVSASSVASGSSITVTLHAKDSAGNNLISGGLLVGFGYAGGASTGTFDSVSDNTNGTYSAQFTGDLAGNATSITATIGGTLVSSVAPSLTVTPGPASVNTSTVAVSSSTISSGSSSTLTLQAKDAAGNNLHTGTLSVVFTYSGGTSTGTIGATSDNSNGTYTAQFTGSTAGTATTINATIGGVSVATSMPTISVTAGASTAANSTITISGGTVVAGSTRTVTLQAKDAAGNNLSSGGLSVAFNITGGGSSGTFSSVTDNHNGTYSASVTGTTSGSASTIGATIDGAVVTSSLPTLAVTPGSISAGHSTVVASNTAVTAGSTLLVTLQAKDSYGNNIATGGASIAFSSGGGTSTGTFSTVVDNTNGSYSANFQGEVAGTATSVSATIGGVSVTTSMPAITVSAGALSLANSAVSLSATSVSSGNSVTATLQAKDSYNNLISSGGAGVTFFRSGGVSNVTFGSVTDNNNGSYSALVTGTTAGSATSIGANIGGSPISTSLPTLTVSPGSISVAQSLVSVSTTALAAGSTLTTTLTAKDSNGNTLTSGGATVAFSVSGGTSSGTFGAVTYVGSGTYTATLTGTTAGTAMTINATLNTDPVTSSLPTVTVVPGPASVSQSTLAIVGAPATVSSGSSVTLILTSRDSYGNSINTGGLDVAFSNASGTSTGSFSTVSDNNNGSYSTTFTGAAAGTATTLRASIGLSLLTSTLPTLQVVPGSSSLVNSTVTLSSSTVVSGSSINATLTARDTYGNQLNTGGLSTSFNVSGGTSTGTFSAVADNSNGTYSSAWTGVLAGTATSIVGRIGVQDLLSAAQSITVTPGSISAVKSFVTVAAQSVISGSTVLVTLNGRDAAGNSIVGGTASTIVFSRLGGNSTGTFSAVTAQGDETYAANFLGLVAGTPTSIRATVNGVAISTALPQITVNPGALSLAQSTIAVSAGTVAADSAVTLVVTSKDANGNTITTGGYTVAFTQSGSGTSSGTIGTVANNGDGTYTASYTGITAGTARNISATINSQAITSTIPSVTVTPGPFSLANSRVYVGSPVSSSATIVQNTSTTLTLVTYDGHNNALTTGNLAVAFQRTGTGTCNGTIGTVTDLNNGSYTASFTGTTGGTPTSITATIGGSSITWTPLPTIQVLLLPVLGNVPADQTFAASSGTPLLVNSNLAFDLQDTVVSGDTAMSYTCSFDKTLNGTLTSGTACTALPGTPATTFNTSTGAFSWTPSTLAWGGYEIFVTGTNAAGTDTKHFWVDIKQLYPTTNLVVDMQADFAKSYVGFGENSTPVDLWSNLVIFNPTVDATLPSSGNFAWTSSSGWAGTGTKAQPYRLVFNRTDLTYADLGTSSGLSSANTTGLTVSSYVQLTEPTYVDSSVTGGASGNRAPVIWTTGGLSGNGIALMQSPAEGIPSTGGPGKLDLVVGGYGPYAASQQIPAFARYRLNESNASLTGGINDSSGNGRNLGTLNGSPTVTTTTGALGDNTSATPAGVNRYDTDPGANFASSTAGPNGTARWYSDNTGIALYNSATYGTTKGAWELWFKSNVTNNSPKFGGLVALSDSGTGRGSSCNTGIDRVVYMDTTGRINVKIQDGRGGGSSRTATSAGRYADGKWHYLAVNWDEQTGLAMYFDGNSTADGTNTTGVTWSFPNSTTPFFIKIGGADFASSGGGVCTWTGSVSSAMGSNRYAGFDGSLDEVIYYNGYTIPTSQMAARFKSYRCQTSSTFTAGTYYNVTASYDPSTRTGKIFVNGVEKCSAVYPSANAPNANSSQNFTLGTNVVGATQSQFWSGWLTDFKVYTNTTTTPLDIYNALSPRHP